MIRLLIVAFATVFLLSGCCIAANAPAATIVDSATTIAATVKPTITPIITTEPSTEPSPTPPSAVKAMNFIDAFIAAKIPLGKVVEYTEETDPNKKFGRPNQYVQKINWGESRVADSDVDLDAGTIEIFLTPEDAKARFDYVEEIGKSLPILGTYNYVFGIYHMRLSLDLTPGQIETYEAIFNRLAK